MSEKNLYHKVIGELEWDIEGINNYYVTKDITLFGEKDKLEFVFNIDSETQEINQRQVNNYLKIMDNPNEIYEKALLEVMDFFNEVVIKYIDNFDFYDFDSNEIPNKVNSIDEVLPFVVLEPLRIHLDRKYYDMAICMGCSWDMEGGVVIKFDNDEIEIGDYDSII